MNRRKIGAVVLFLLVACCPFTPAATPAQQFAPQLNECKVNTNWLQDYLANLVNTMQQPPSLGKLDETIITADVQKEIAAWNSAAALWEKGDEAKATAQVKLARDLGSRRGIWERRLSWRWRQGNESPSEDSFEGLNWRPPQSVAVYMEAKKRLSEACGRVAEAITPDANLQEIPALEDQVFAAQVEVEVADMKMNWSAEDHSWAMRDAVSSPELSAAQQRLDEFRRQREAMFRQIRQQQRALEKYDRGNNALVGERDRQAELARQARERATQK